MPTQRPAAQAPKLSNRSFQFSLSLSKEQRKQLMRLAAEADMTMRAFVLSALKGLPVEPPSRREETQALKDYIADLKGELEDAEERLKEVEKSPER
jgi:hypothetical protein